MDVRNRGGASLLFEKLQSLKDNPNSWRCIYINLSAKRGTYSPHLIRNFFCSPVVKLLASHDGTIYLHEDGDIFILFQGALTPVLSKLNAHFGDLEADESPDYHQENMFSIFDVGRDWDSLYKLCEDKHYHAEYMNLRRHAHKYPSGHILRSFTEIAG